jgi:uncharacterized membrane protein
VPSAGSDWSVLVIFGADVFNLRRLTDLSSGFGSFVGIEVTGGFFNAVHQISTSPFLLEENLNKYCNK